MYDALLILGGGVTKDHTPPEWVQRRINKAIEMKNQTKFFIATSFVTPHKPPYLDKHGLIVSDSYIIGQALIEQGIKPDRILYENYSADTLGNIFFTRFLHTDLRNLPKIGIITSTFQMPRAKILAEWIFNVPPNTIHYSIDYFEVSDNGIDPKIIEPRIKKEQKRTERMVELSQKIKTVEQLHHWLYTEHSGYTLYLRDELVANRENDTTLQSY